MICGRAVRKSITQTRKLIRTKSRFSSASTSKLSADLVRPIQEILPFTKSIQQHSRPLESDTFIASNHGARIRQLQEGKLFDRTTGNLNVRPMALREACECSLCVDPSDRQRNYSFADIPTDISVKTCETDSDGNYLVRWNNDIMGNTDHVSAYTSLDVKGLGNKQSQPGLDLFKRPTRLLNNSTFDIEKSTIPFGDYMTSSKSLAYALHFLWQDGLVFVNNIPEEESAIAQIAERIGPLRNTFYGSTWNVRSVPQAKNVAYTSKYLGFHMDLLYMKEPPGFQLLHCLQNSCTGGESRFADTLKAADIIISEDRTTFDDLTSTNIRYQYFNDGFAYTDKKPIFQRRTNDSHPARIVADAQNADMIAQINRIYWSPPFVGSAIGDFDVPNVEKSIRSAKRFANALESEDVAIETKLPAGTCAIFDNLRVVHARNAFDINSGYRWLRGAYVDYQDFCSKANGLESEMPQ